MTDRRLLFGRRICPCGAFPARRRTAHYRSGSGVLRRFVAGSDPHGVFPGNSFI